MIDLAAFQQLILLDAAIRERTDGHPPHGLAIKHDLTEWYTQAGELNPDEQVNHGRLYPNLDKLVTRGLIEKSERDNRTNEYRVTEPGYEAIQNLHSLIQIALGADQENPWAAQPPAAPADD
jgi:DNA-binding PadR family transcriptional regulator